MWPRVARRDWSQRGSSDSRSVKYEEVYLNAYELMTDAKQSLENYFEFYNQQRKHQTLKSKPDQVYYESIRKLQPLYNVWNGS